MLHTDPFLAFVSLLLPSQTPDASVCVCVRFGSCDREGVEEMQRGGGERERLLFPETRERER